MVTPLVLYKGQDKSTGKKWGMQVLLSCSLIIFKILLSNLWLNTPCVVTSYNK